MTATVPLMQTGNASKRLKDPTPGPWMGWAVQDRAARAIRFLETYCVPPKGYGAGKPLALAPWQKDWLEETLADGVDAAATQLPRGNGKSTFLAALAVWGVFDPDDTGVPQVPVVATTVGQAIRSVYGVASAMVQQHPDLERRHIPFTAVGATRLTVPFTGGELFPIANQPDTLQGLDPSLAICDEVGFQSIESWDSLLLAGGKRPHSLVVGIGTPGLDRDNALWHLRQRVLEGGKIPGFCFTEYAADEGCDVRDETQWFKANPALAAGYMNIKALRTAVEMSPEGHFRIFRLGQWVDGVESWLGPDGFRIWAGLRDPYEFVDGAPTWCGIDVGIKRDSTAVVAVQRRPDGRWHVKCRVWMPQPDVPVDVTDVMQYVRELHGRYDLREAAFDARFFDVPGQMLHDEWLNMVEIPQSPEVMTPACGNALEVIKGGQVSHDGDEVLTNHVLNAVPRFNERGFTLQKQKSRGKIDACIAAVIGLHRAALSADPSVYSPDRGLMTL